MLQTAAPIPLEIMKGKIWFNLNHLAKFRPHRTDRKDINHKQNLNFWKLVNLLTNRTHDLMTLLSQQKHDIKYAGKVWRSFCRLYSVFKTQFAHNCKTQKTKRRNILSWVHKLIKSQNIAESAGILSTLCTLIAQRKIYQVYRRTDAPKGPWKQSTSHTHPWKHDLC